LNQSAESRSSGPQFCCLVERIADIRSIGAAARYDCLDAASSAA